MKYCKKDLVEFLKSKPKTEIIEFIANYMISFIQPLGHDADIQFDIFEEDNELGIYCTHTGERLL